MSKFSTALCGAGSLGATYASFDGLEPSFDELEQIESSASVTDAEIAAVNAESNLLSAIDQLAAARAKASLLRLVAESAA